MTSKLDIEIKYKPLSSCNISNSNLYHLRCSSIKKKILGKMRDKAWPSKLWKIFSLCCRDMKIMKRNTSQNQALCCPPSLLEEGLLQVQGSVSSGLQRESRVIELHMWEKAKRLCYTNNYVYGLTKIKTKKENQNASWQDFSSWWEHVTGHRGKLRVHHLKSSKEDLFPPPDSCSVPSCGEQPSPHQRDSAEISGTLKQLKHLHVWFCS